MAADGEEEHASARARPHSGKPRLTDAGKSRRGRPPLLPNLKLVSSMAAAPPVRRAQTPAPPRRRMRTRRGRRRMRPSRGRRTSRPSGAAACASPPSDAAPPWPPPATLHLQPPFPVASADAPKPWPPAPPSRRMRLRRPPRISGRPPLERATGRPVRSTAKSLSAPCSSALALHARETERDSRRGVAGPSAPVSPPPAAFRRTDGPGG
ncbi:unnamed protein product [Urochloa humidicola]